MRPFMSSNHSAAWQDYYERTHKRPPRDTLVMALANFGVSNEPRFAVDLGCGAGNDAVELLHQGWRVLAIDKEQNAIDSLRKRVPENSKTRLQTKISPFEGLTLPTADLVNASFALPFCRPHHFAALWEQIEGALGTNGRFSGHFFGLNDSWATHATQMTFLSYDQIQTLFQAFAIEHFAEKDEAGSTAMGEEKHWHIFSIVARKII